MQLYSFTVLCEALWHFKVANDLKSLAHIWQTYRFSSLLLWNCLCLFSSFMVLNAMVHRLHVKGLRLVCCILCVLRFEIFLKDFSHLEHLCGLSSLWRRICLLRLLILVNVFSQCEQAIGDFPSTESIRWCDLQAAFVLNVWMFERFEPYCAIFLSERTTECNFRLQRRRNFFLLAKEKLVSLMIFRLIFSST